MDCQNSFAKLQKMKNTQSTIKPVKIGQQYRATYRFGCNNYTQNFRPGKVKMAS